MAMSSDMVRLCAVCGGTLLRLGVRIHGATVTALYICESCGNRCALEQPLVDNDDSA